MADSVNDQLYAAIEGTLTRFGEAIVETIKGQLAEKKKIASGELYNSVVFQISYNDGIATLEILAEDYFKYIENGRTPGSKAPPIFDIVKWLQFRTLDVLGTPFARKAKGNYLTAKGNVSKKKLSALIQKGNDPKNVVRTAFVIARAIKRNGIPPLGALKKANADYTDRLFVAISESVNQKLGEIVGKQFEEAFSEQNIEVITTYN